MAEFAFENQKSYFNFDTFNAHMSNKMLGYPVISFENKYPAPCLTSDSQIFVSRCKFPTVVALIESFPQLMFRQDA